LLLLLMLPNKLPLLAPYAKRRPVRAVLLPVVAVVVEIAMTVVVVMTVVAVVAVATVVAVAVAVVARDAIGDKQWQNCV
jgi:hypothetical protein